MNERSLWPTVTFRIAIAPLLTALALIGCSASKSDLPGHVNGGSSSAGASSTGAAGAGSGASANGAAGNSFNLDLDGGLGTPDQDASAGCSRLNIGIFGKQGANNSSNFEQWLTRAGTSVQRIQTTPDEPVTAATLAPFDVIILDCLQREYTTDEATSFATWVSAGGGVAALSGYYDNTEIDWHANSLLAPLGVAFSGDRVWGPATSFAMHPITQGLSSVTFTGGYPVADLGGSASTREPIAFITHTPPVPVAFAVQMGSGRAFLWGDEWIEFDSEWATIPQIPQLWVQIFSWLAPKTTCELNPPK